MKSCASLVRRSLIACSVGLTGLLGVALLDGGTASAGPVPPTDPARSARVLAALERQLGDRTPGTYLDASNRPVVTVTDDATAEAVAAAGAVPKRVRYPRAALDAARSRLEAMPAIPGTTWATDPANNQVVVGYDAGVTGASLQRLREVAGSLGDAVRTEPVTGLLSTRISGGDAIFGRGGRCSLGFTVKRGGQDFFLTAGHCGNAVRTWFADPSRTTPLGTTVASRFPGRDFALVRVVNPAIPLESAAGGQAITSAGTPAVGETVTRRGSTTGVHRGRVTALDATVTYPEGRVTGLIRTTVCAEPGDSGGPLFSGTTALGLTSGGSGDCRQGGETFFQPVVPALDAVGASLP